jgi:hypothetical protein
MQLLSNIDWNSMTVYGLLFEQIIAASDAKQNSSFELLVSLVNTIVSFLTKKRILLCLIHHQHNNLTTYFDTVVIQ